MWQAVGEGSWVFKGARVPTPKAVGEGAGRVVGRGLVGFTVQYDRDLRWGSVLGTTETGSEATGLGRHSVETAGPLSTTLSSPIALDPVISIAPLASASVLQPQA